MKPRIRSFLVSSVLALNFATASIHPAAAELVSYNCFADYLGFNATNTAPVVFPIESSDYCSATVSFTSTAYGKFLQFSREMECLIDKGWGACESSEEIPNENLSIVNVVPVGRLNWLRPEYNYFPGYPTSWSDGKNTVFVRHLYARVPFKDNFDRSLLGPTWTKPTGVAGDTISIASNRLVSTAWSVPSLTTVVNPIHQHSNVSISATVNVVNTRALSTYTVVASLMARFLNDKNYYFGALVNRTGVYSLDIYKVVAGNPTRIAYQPLPSGSINPASTSIRFTVSADPKAGSSTYSVLQIFLNGAYLPSVTAHDDQLPQPGRVGARLYGTAKLDNFHATRNFIVPSYQCDASGYCVGHEGTVLY